MDGDVGFRSVFGEGSEFWVDMPAHASGARSSVLPPARERSSERLASDGPRLVLYVEDNPANVTFMSDLVSTMEEIELLTAPTAEMGIDLARARQPDAIIMDINLPGMSGTDALRELRTLPETRDIPVIALTAAASHADRRRGAEAGFAQYLTKPVNVGVLLGDDRRSRDGVIGQKLNEAIDGQVGPDGEHLAGHDLGAVILSTGHLLDRIDRGHQSGRADHSHRRKPCVSRACLPLAIGLVGNDEIIAQDVFAQKGGFLAVHVFANQVDQRGDPGGCAFGRSAGDP